MKKILLTIAACAVLLSPIRASDAHMSLPVERFVPAKTPLMIKITIDSYKIQLKQQRILEKQQALVDKLMSYLKALDPHELAMATYQFLYFADCFALIQTPLEIRFVEIPSSTEPEKTERKLGIVWSDGIGQAFLSALISEIGSTKGLAPTHQPLIKSLMATDHPLINRKAFWCTEKR